MSKWSNIGICAAVVLVLTVFVTVFRRDRSLTGVQLETPNAGDEQTRHSDAANFGSQTKDNVMSGGRWKNQVKGRISRLNGGIATYSEDLQQRMADLFEQKVDARNPELVQLVRDIVDPPSNSKMLKLSHQCKHTPQSKEIEAVLKQKRNGFFVECGALDGERSSNTLYLEKELGWTGLLVEMDPHFYTQLLGKARKSWSLNACISLYSYATLMTFKGSSGGKGQVEEKTSTNTTVASVPCFPLETILLALNQSHVDYFSLDVEGAELDILRTIPYDRLTIDTLSVEYIHGRHDVKKMILEYMLSQNYRMHKDIQQSDLAIYLFVDDYIFVRNSIS